MEGWPFPTRPSCASDKSNAESKAWVESYTPFSEKAQNAFNKCQFGSFAARAFANFPDDVYRCSVDLINYYFVFDELTDEMDANNVRVLIDGVMNTMRNPSAPALKNEHLCITMMRDFWLRTLALKATDSFVERFLRDFEEYLETVWQQAVDRETGLVRPTADYFKMRRGTIGVRTSTTFMVVVEDLPKLVAEHPYVETMIRCSIDLSIMSNDIYSFNVEQAHGDQAHNLVSVTMAERDVDIQGAIDIISAEYDRCRLEFLRHFNNLPDFGNPKVNGVLERFCLRLGSWVTTNDEWSFLTPRYFGEEYEQVRKTRTVKLLPRI
ncbi:terpenoid synthase, partial [Cylindrobasidium torrendii FP15055 ss-10]